MKSEIRKTLIPVGYQSSDLLDSSSEDSQDGFYTGLLDRARIQWLMGDWEGLSKIDLEQIEHHPDRAKIALLASAGLIQAGEDIKAQKFMRLAKDWGVSKKFACNILAAGMHNNLGRVAVVSGNQLRALKHFENAIVVGNHSSEKSFLAQARISDQYKRIAATANQTHPIEATDKQSYKKLDNIDVGSFQEKLKNAKEARAGKDYDHAEALLQEVLGDDPKNVEALRELGRLKSAQELWSQAIDVYNRLLQTQNIALEAILARARMRLNTGKMKESIAELEKAKALGFESTSLTHQLAVAYRDDRQWEAAEQKIDEILEMDARYANKKITFATFAADVLRKRDRVEEAQALLQGAVDAANAKRVTIPPNTSAILQELNREIKGQNASCEVSKYYYDDIYSSSQKYMDSPLNSIYIPVWKKLVEFINTDGIRTVLDIGCGPGQFAEYILQQIPNIQYQGIDYSRVAIDQARLRCPQAHFYNIDVNEGDKLLNINADAYVLLEVLEHMEHDIELIKKIPAGKKVILSVPNFDAIAHVRFFLNEHEVYDRYSRYIKFLSSELVLLKKRSALHLVKGIKV
jgi:2-polyprenyl-3-methyl-5-hydroxy-6-metoxy-1,4-benzoquinol methylase